MEWWSGGPVFSLRSKCSCYPTTTTRTNGRSSEHFGEHFLWVRFLVVLFVILGFKPMVG
jgi:hypothetical protein